VTFQYNDIVIVERGKHKGFVGFVDNDESHGRVILYDLTPTRIENGYVVVKESSIRKLNDDEIQRLVAP